MFSRMNTVTRPVTCGAMLLAVTGLLTGATASAAKPVIVVRGGAETPTRGYVWGVMAHNLRGDHGDQSRKAQVTKMSAANIYRKLMAGKINVASVLLGPDEAGVKEFAAWRKKNRPTMLTLGSVGVYVIAPGNREIKQLSLQQIKDLLAGRITTWKQLGGRGEGNIRLVADGTALHLHHALTGEKPKAKIRNWGGPETVASYCSQVAVRTRQEALVRRAEEMRRRAKAGERPPKPEPALMPMGDDALGLTVSRKVLHWSSNPGRQRLSVIPLYKDKEKPIPPSGAAVQDRTYPLSFTWRIYAHPRASELVLGCVKACIGAHEGSLGNAHYVRAWLFPNNKVAAPGTVWVMVNRGWDGALRAAAADYQKSRAGTNVRFARVRYDFGKKFQAGDVDILAYSAPFPHFGGRWIETELRQLYGPKWPEQTIAHRALAVVVPSKNPVKSLTWEQVRYVASHDLTPWTLLGGDRKGWVHKYYRGSSMLRECLFDGKKYKRVRIRQTLNSAGGGKPRDFRDHTREDFELYKQVCKLMNTPEHLLAALADDSAGMGFMLYSKRVQASGLKVLALGGPGGREPVLPTPTGIANGAYPARLAMRVLVHPRATQASRDFVKWLSSAQAGRVMKEYYVFNATVAQGPAVVLTNAATPKETPAISFDKPISGTVAVMPGETLSRYFVVAKPKHHAAYEQAITEGLARDRRLKIVDRAELNRVLAERALVLSRTKETTPKPILVADVFVLPQITSEGTAAVLRIQALHGATGSVLGELRLAVDPANPEKLTPPLSEQVRRWWPGVLKRLWLAKHRPVWSLVGVYSGQSGALDETAEAVQAQLRKKLMSDAKRFLADYAPLGMTYREVLMRLLGLSRSWRGRFSPAADYLIEGRLTSAKRLECRILSGRGKRVLAATTIESDTPVALADKAWAWLDAKAASLPAESGGSDTALDDWAKSQARLEFQKGQSISKRAEKFFKEAERRRMIAGSPDLLPTDKKELDRLNGQGDRHYLRSAQLDPTWEEAAYKTLRVTSKALPAFGRNLMLAEAYTRFSETFPRSKRSRGVMEYAYVYWRNLAGTLRGTRPGSVRVPRGIDRGKLYLQYLRKSLDVRREYFKRYMHRDETPHGGQRQSMTSFYLSDTALYLVMSKASDAQIRQTVADYGELLDKHPSEAIHSDFLKLHLIAWRNDKAGFLKMLRGMQKQHQDPKDAYWRLGARWADQDVRRLFGLGHGDRNTLRWWLDGKRGPGDLPYVGYDQKRDKHKPGPRP